MIDVAELRSLLERATPGPWAVVEYGDGDSLVIHDARGDWRVCFMATPGKDGDFAEIETNARMIVALRNNAEALLDTLAQQAERLAVAEKDHQQEMSDLRQLYYQVIEQRNSYHTALRRAGMI